MFRSPPGNAQADTNCRNPLGGKEGLHGELVFMSFARRPHERNTEGNKVPPHSCVCMRS